MIAVPRENGGAVPSPPHPTRGCTWEPWAWVPTGNLFNFMGKMSQINLLRENCSAYLKCDMSDTCPAVPGGSGCFHLWVATNDTLTCPGEYSRKAAPRAQSLRMRDGAICRAESCEQLLPPSSWGCLPTVRGNFLRASPLSGFSWRSSALCFYVPTPRAKRRISSRPDAVWSSSSCVWCDLLLPMCQ